jgi:UDP-N-acetylglucosamine 2-epimerase (non-hydrolysing)
LKILNVCGARPNFMKIAPLLRAFAARPELTPILVHTGQHYTNSMNARFFDELRIPAPAVNLDVGSHSHAVQTGLIMQRFEPVLLEHRPDAVLVVGDVNSTMACALVAAKLDTPVFHVEAGLRSFDRSMPEEINRLVTDALSDLLFVSEPSGLANLRREGVSDERIHVVGNVMIDTLRDQLRLAAGSRVLETLALRPRGYAALTLHRPSNVDDPAVFGRICDALDRIHERLDIVFPVHPRTRARMTETGIAARLARMPRLRCTEPLGYLDFLRLIADAAVVLTDSGGIQEETTVLGVPCLTLRNNTERPVTVDQGTNQLVGTDPRRITAACERALASPPAGRIPDLWDGRAAERIADIIVAWSARRRTRHAGG